MADKADVMRCTNKLVVGEKGPEELQGKTFEITQFYVREGYDPDVLARLEVSGY